MTSAKNVNCMDIHKPFDEFAKVYGFKDTEEVYTNGIELIPVFRVKQWLEQEPCEDCCNGNQIEKAKLCQKSYLAGMEHKQEPNTGHWIKTISENGVTSAVRCSECGFEDNRYMLFRYCPNCGARMESEE